MLPSIVNEVTKAVVAQYNASELLTKRDLVSKQIRDMLTKRAGDFMILLDDVSITHLAFSKEYTAAVEAKQVAQQDSERAKYIVERALQEKKSIVIKAEGEAQSAKLIGNVCAALRFIFRCLMCTCRPSKTTQRSFSCEESKPPERCDVLPCVWFKMTLCVQIAGMVVSSANKVYLNADSLMINTLGDSDLHENEDTSAKKGKPSGWGL